MPVKEAKVINTGLPTGTVISIVLYKIHNSNGLHQPFNDKQEPVPVPEGLIITLLHCFKNDVPVDSKQKVTIEDVP